MTVSPNDVLKVTARLAGYSGQDIMNVFYFRHDGLFDITDSDASDDLSGFLDTLYGDVDALIPVGAAFMDITLHNETTNVTLPLTTWPTLTLGTGSGDGLAEGVALLIGLNTGVPRVHGRKYLAPMIEARTNGQVWDGTALTAAATFASRLVGSFVGGASGHNWLPGVIDKALDFWSFTEAVVSAIPAYQRRRRPRTGS